MAGAWGRAAESQYGSVQQQMYAEMLHARAGLPQTSPYQMPPMQRKKRRRTPTALCIKDGRAFLRPFSDLPQELRAKSLAPEPSPYQPPNMSYPPLNPYASMMQQYNLQQQQVTIGQVSVVPSQMRLPTTKPS